MSNYLSYKQIFQDRIKFRQAGTAGGTDFNNYDFPGSMYFRILFHFYNVPGTNDSGTSLGSGLLHPTWQLLDDQSSEGGATPNYWVEQQGHGSRAYEYLPWRYNTAYSYLITNDEQERAQYLKHFITLLSNINSESPWYFKSVKGIEEAVNRKQFTETFEFKERGRLIIECMPDSFDQRISTLLDLYRAAAYSWSNKREIIPANLRKFDMSVIVFQAPIQGMHIPSDAGDNMPSLIGQISTLAFESDANYATLDPKQNGPMQASYKIYEFHNCEFDYNSTTAAGESITNEESFNPTYNIGIFYDDMYESRYNQFEKFEPVEVSISNRSAASNNSLSQQHINEYNTQAAEAKKKLAQYEADQKAKEAAAKGSAEMQALQAKINSVQGRIDYLTKVVAAEDAKKKELNAVKAAQSKKTTSNNKKGKGNGKGKGKTNTK